MSGSLLCHYRYSNSISVPAALQALPLQTDAAGLMQLASLCSIPMNEWPQYLLFSDPGYDGVSAHPSVIPTQASPPGEGGAESQVGREKWMNMHFDALLL